MQHAVSFAAALPTVPAQIPHGGCLDCNNGLFPPFPIIAASSPPSYSSSFHSSYYIHNSISSHSLPLHLQFPDHLNTDTAFSSSSSSACQMPLPLLSSSPSSSSGDFRKFSSGAIRRVFSTGDLQGTNVLPPPLLSGDNCGQGSGLFSQEVRRYSPEERKERIERYRIKRHQRSFNKKISYVCRKTLADSRPRVKGRFARSSETEAEEDTDLEKEASDNSYEYCNYNSLATITSSFYDSHKGSHNSTAFGVDNGEWWSEMLVASGATGQVVQQLGFDGHDGLWTSLADMCQE